MRGRCIEGCFRGLVGRIEGMYDQDISRVFIKLSKNKYILMLSKLLLKISKS